MVLPGSAQLSEDQQGTFFQAVLDRSLTAEAKAGAIERHFSIAGHVICLRFAGKTLIESFTPALAHLAVPATTRPDAVLHIWDCHSTGVAMVSPPCPRACFTSRGDIWTMDSQRFRSAYLWSEYALNLFDTKSATGVYWTQGIAPLPYWAKASPLRCLLHWWAETKGCQLLHAAAVGCGDSAMLITGKGGLGKSTTALACLDKGLRYLGDDYVLVSLDPVARVHSLYSSAKLNWDQVRRFPRFADLLANPDRADVEKAVFYLHPGMNDQIVESLPLRLIATPRIADVPTTEPETISKRALRQAAAFTTLAQLPHASGRTYTVIERLVDRVPGLQLALGHRFDGIATTIARLLERPVPHLQSPPEDAGALGQPLLSVIIPARNAAPQLQGTIASVLAQNYPAVEIIVVDDGSSDEIDTAVRALPLEVRFLKQGHLGSAGARNRGIRECSGDLITFLDAGNLWPAGALSAMLELMASDRKCDIARGVGRGREAGGKQEDQPAFTLAGAVYRRRVFETIGLFDQTSPFGEDSAWLSRARSQGLKLRQLAQVTLLIRRPDPAGDASPLEAKALYALKDALNRQRSAGPTT